MTDDPDGSRDAGGRFTRVYPVAVHTAVQDDYEHTPATVQDICDKHHVPASTIYLWARVEGWVGRRPRRVDPSNLVARMLGLLDRQIAELETVMKDGASEVAMLAKLVTTLDRVLALKDRTAAKPTSGKRVQELRAKIAERIGELNRA